ncbi:p077 [Rhizobium phage 16-3]|uniref:Sak4-like ssDNA annealing protein n=1 Tax=Rhizobium phage 16-3 TaxID=10704 RepID=UPI00017BA61E|nr:Sak4-like ssDNA annealing protein [Rhizobium phage 16-3]ABF71355.1 p077 [Rhizobium phage 16-3]
MAISLSSLKSTKRNDPPIILLYGVDGIGKTSLAAEFPDPIYLATDGERAPSDVDLLGPSNDDGTPAYIESFEDIIDIFGELWATEHDRKTVIIDSLDGFEPLVWRATCARLGIESIESAGFGKGYVEADTEWNEFLSAVSALAQRGICVVMLAHPEIVRFDSPVTDPYSRYQPKLHKRANALVREKSDIVAFLNYRISIKEKEVARQTKIAHAEGGKERQIHLNEGAGFNAKNRYSMPDTVTYKKGQGFTELAKYFPAPTGVA